MKFKVVECEEFETLGSVKETENIENAIKLYREINSKQLSGIPAIKIIYYNKEWNDYFDVTVVRGNNVALDDLEYVPNYVLEEIKPNIEVLRNLLNDSFSVKE